MIVPTYSLVSGSVMMGSPALWQGEGEQDHSWKWEARLVEVYVHLFLN